MTSKDSKTASWTKLSTQALKPAIRLLTRPSTLKQLPRLFTEGLGPVRRMFIQAHNQRELTRLVHTGQRVNFISSFARSGNTWTRNLLADALLQAQGVETSTELPTPVHEVVPDYYCDLIAKRHPSITMPGVLVKTHDTYDQLRARIYGASGAVPSGQPAFANCRIVYLFRSPEDVLVSFFHLQRKMKYIEKSQFGIDEFCRTHLPHWVANMTGFLRAADEGVPVYFVSYEAMVRDPVANLTGILRWLEIPHDGLIVQRAVDHMNFAHLREKHERSAPGVSEFSLRRGKSGAGVEELQPQTRCDIRDASAALIKQAQKYVNRQGSMQRPTTTTPSANPDTQSESLDRFASSAGLQPT